MHLRVNFIRGFASQAGPLTPGLYIWDIYIYIWDIGASLLKQVLSPLAYIYMGYIYIWVNIVVIPIRPLIYGNRCRTIGWESRPKTSVNILFEIGFSGVMVFSIL